MPFFKIHYHPSRNEFDELVELYGKEQFSGLGVEYSNGLVLYRAKGCAACGMTGYRGRAGIYELLLGTDDMKRLIQAKSPVEQIMQQAISDGMKTLFQDGIQKAFQGISDIKMVRRVCIM